MFANNMKELPQVSRIGDIIRIHRVNTSKYNGHYQLNANMYYNVSFVMFSGNPDYEHSYEHIQMKSELSTPSKFIRLLENEDRDMEMSDPTLTQFNESSL